MQNVTGAFTGPTQAFWMYFHAFLHKNLHLHFLRYWRVSLEEGSYFRKRHTLGLEPPDETRKSVSAKITDLNLVPDAEQRGARYSCHQTIPARSESNEVKTNKAKTSGLLWCCLLAPPHLSTSTTTTWHRFYLVATAVAALPGNPGGVFSRPFLEMFNPCRLESELQGRNSSHMAPAVRMIGFRWLAYHSSPGTAFSCKILGSWPRKKEQRQTLCSWDD